MQKNNEQDDLRALRMGPFTLLQFMGLLAALGFLGECMLRHFFS